MDFGDWMFIGVAVISGIASIAKAAKKKETAQSSQPNSSHDEEKAGTDEWIKNILRETTKGISDLDDEFIPKNKPTQQQTREKPVVTTAQSNSGQTGKKNVAEDYRRDNQSLERFSRQHVSLEDSVTIEGNVQHKGVSVSSGLQKSQQAVDCPLLDPIVDLNEAEEVRKAIVYGEIMRPKF